MRVEGWDLCRKPGLGQHPKLQKATFAGRSRQTYKDRRGGTSAVCPFQEVLQQLPWACYDLPRWMKQQSWHLEVSMWFQQAKRATDPKIRFLEGAVCFHPPLESTCVQTSAAELASSTHRSTEIISPHLCYNFDEFPAAWLLVILLLCLKLFHSLPSNSKIFLTPGL